MDSLIGYLYLVEHYHIIGLLLEWLLYNFFICNVLPLLLDLAGIDRGVLMRALRLLEQKGKAAIFKGTSADDEGVKFSA